MITNPSQGLHMTGTTMWYHTYRQEYGENTKKAMIYYKMTGAIK
jgi:hypothetical protein